MLKKIVDDESGYAGGYKVYIDGGEYLISESTYKELIDADATENKRKGLVWKSR